MPLHERLLVETLLAQSLLVEGALVMTTELRAELMALLPAGRVVVEPDELERYRWDRAGDPDAGVPFAVVRATSTAEVQTAVRFAAGHSIPIVPRGAGTGLSGGSSAIQGGLVISTEAMRSITVDPVTRTVVTEPGLLNREVKAAAREHGLWYPPDPASFEICSIGGNIATNAGGLCCVKYGVTGDYVLGMTVVLADGSAVGLGGALMKDVAGLALTKLFVGSEGTLGIITSVTLRLIPAQQPPCTIIATFADLDDAMAVVLDVTRRMRPSMLEFMDRATINAVEDLSPQGFDRSAAAVLVLQSDEPGEAGRAQMEDIAATCRRYTPVVLTTHDAETGERYVAARRAAIPAVEAKGALLLGDVGVPVPSLGMLARGIEEISAGYDVTIALIAHAGDGNTHPLVVLDPDDAAQRERAHIAYGMVTELAIELGGTITGEHGVGRLKLPWLRQNIGEDVIALNRKIKAALDPAGILNPGAGY